MGLTSSLLIGRSALQASQSAIQVTGNNIANAATEGYHRQRVELAPVRGSRELGNYIGRGVSLADVSRAIDPSIQARMRNSMGEESAALVQSRVLDTIESLAGELTGGDLSSQLSRFFNSWSELANTPESSAARTVVVEEGAALASRLNALRGELVVQREQVEKELAFATDRANGLLEEVAQLNVAVVNGEQGFGEAGNLRDQRDSLLDELATLMDIQVIEQETGAVDVLVNSAPLILGTATRGVELQIRSVQDPVTLETSVDARVVSVVDGEEIRINGGTIGGLLDQRGASIQRTIDDLDEVASGLIFAVNDAHASGRPSAGVSELVGERRYTLAEQVLPLNDPTNETMAGLPFSVKNGSFSVEVRDENGNLFTRTVEVDLDGIRSTDGAPGVDEDMSLEDLRAALDSIANLNAEITGQGELRVFTDAGYTVSFGEDTSGVLAAVGLNTFFTGTDAGDIAVRSAFDGNPGLLVSGSGVGDNSIALRVAGLREEPLAMLNGSSISERWQRSVEVTSVEASSARTTLASERVVRENLQAQERAVGGVSLDEESMNLILYQQQYSGAARFVATIDELTQLLLSLV